MRVLFCLAAQCCLSAVALAAPFVPARDPQCVAVSPSGSVVATGTSGLADGLFPPRPHPDVRKCGVVAVWDVASGKRMWRSETYGDITRVAFSPDGALVAFSRLYETADGLALHEVRLCDAVSGKIVRSLDRCHAFALSPAGKFIAVASRTKCVIYDLSSWEKEIPAAELAGAVSLAYDATGETLLGVCRGEEGFAVKACSAADGKYLRQGPMLKEPFYTLAASPDGAWLATGHAGGQVVLWDPAKLEPQARLATGVDGLAHPFFAPDGRTLGAGVQSSGDVIFWDVESRREVHRYAFDSGAFRTYLSRAPDEKFRPERDPGRFAFSPDGQAFFTGAYGGILRQLNDGRELRRFGD